MIHIVSSNYSICIVSIVNHYRSILRNYSIYLKQRLFTWNLLTLWVENGGIIPCSLSISHCGYHQIVHLPITESWFAYWRIGSFQHIWWKKECCHLRYINTWIVHKYEARYFAMNAKHSPESTARLTPPFSKRAWQAQVSLRSALSVFESDFFQHVPVEKVCQGFKGHLGGAPCDIVTLLLVLTCINSVFLFEKKMVMVTAKLYFWKCGYDDYDSWDRGEKKHRINGGIEDYLGFQWVSRGIATVMAIYQL